MTQAITLFRAQQSETKIGQEITVSANQGEANQIADDFFFETDTFHTLFSFEFLRTPKAAFALFPLKDGRRLNDKALPTSIFALDFDAPTCPAIQSVMAFFQGCDYVCYTTKSHQLDKKGVTCDRFRIVLPLSKPIAPAAMKEIVHYFTDLWHGDASTFDGARFFYTGIESSDVWRNFGKPLSTEWLLSLIPSKTHQNGLNFAPKSSKLKGHKDYTPIVLDTIKAHSKHVSFLREKWPSVKDKSDNTYSNVFSLMMLWIQTFGFNLAALKAALPKVVDIADFYNRNPHQWRGIDSTLEKALAYVLGSDRNNLQHKNEVEAVDTDSLPFTEDTMDVCAKAADLTGSQVGDFEDSAKLIDYVFKTHRKAIIDIQCGGGKSVVSSAIVSKSGDRWLIVKDTNQACRTQREMLLKYGVPRQDIQVLSGWSAEMCEENLTALESLKWGAAKRRQKKPAIDRARDCIEDGFTPFYSKKDSPCIECQAWCDFRATRTHRQVIGALNHRRIVVMTHARFLEVVHFAELKNRRVLIDEEPSVFEGVGFASKEIELLLHVFKSVLDGKVERHLNSILSTTKTGSIQDLCFYTHAEIKTLQGRASKQDADTKETCYKYIRFMSYEADRFAFVEKDVYGKKISFVRNRLNFEIENDVYVLSASARFSSVTWEGFKVVRSECQNLAEGVTVYAYPANHTKHRMDKEAEAFLAYAVNLIKTNGRKKVMLALNKEDNQSKEVKTAVAWFKTECGKLGVEVTEGERGSIIGRNDWKDCDCVILGYGVFTSIANIALKQSLVEGAEIEGSRLWDTKTIGGVEVSQPKIKKGLVDAGLRETDRRVFANEVYQVGLRGIARKWNSESMDIITIAPSLDYVIPLTQVLPGATICFDELDVTGIRTQDLLQGDAELCQRFGMTDNAPNRETARQSAGELLSGKIQGAE